MEGIHKTVRLVKRWDFSDLLLTIMTLRCLTGDSSDRRIYAFLSSLTVRLFTGATSGPGVILVSRRMGRGM